MTWSKQRADARRLHIAVPVRIAGLDTNGVRFECEAWTLNVSPTGASIQIPADLDVPSQFHVTSDDYQFRADADVFVVWERSAPQRCVGVRVDPRAPDGAWEAR